MLVDDLFAAGYGGGFGLLFWSLARCTTGTRRMPGLVVGPLRFSAACYPVAAAFDLLENQLTATLLLLPPGGRVDALILVARYCAIPKYDLALLAGPLPALLAGALAFAAWARHLAMAR